MLIQASNTDLAGLEFGIWTSPRFDCKVYYTPQLIPWLFLGQTPFLQYAVPFCQASCSQVENQGSFAQNSTLWAEGWAGRGILARALFSWILKKARGIKICSFSKGAAICWKALISLKKRWLLLCLGFLWPNVDYGWLRKALPKRALAVQKYMQISTVLSQESDQSHSITAHITEEQQADCN